MISVYLLFSHLLFYYLFFLFPLLFPFVSFFWFSIWGSFIINFLKTWVMGQSPMNEGCACSGWCSSENFLNRFDWFVKAPAFTKVYKIFTVFDLIGFADIVNGHDLPEGLSRRSLEGKMVLLESDLDLAEVCEHMEAEPYWG